MTTTEPQHDGGTAVSESAEADGSALRETADLVRSPSTMAKILGQLEWARYSGIMIFLVLIVIYSIWLPDTFPTMKTVQSIAASQSIGGMLALAVLFPLSAGVFDLSAAANVTFCSVMCAALMQEGPKLSPFLAIVIALAAGALVGVFNGTLIAYVGLDSFMATLGTTSLLTAGSAIIGGGTFFGAFPDSFTAITAQKLFDLPVIVIYLLVLAFLAWYVLEHTPLGRRIHAVGANREAARLTGIDSRRIVFWQYVVCGTGAAIAGILIASQLDSTYEGVGGPYLLPAYAAAFLGTTQIKPGRFNVWGTVLAIFLLGTITTGMQLAGASVWITDLSNGIALIGAVSVAVIAGRRSLHKQKEAAVQKRRAAKLADRRLTTGA